MGSFVFNVARGRVRYFYDAVDASIVVTSGVYTSTANAALLVVAINRGADTDSILRDYDTLALLLAGAPNEATNSGYARKVLTDSDLTASAEDDTNEVLDLDVPDQTWVAVQAAGGAWTDLVIAFRPDSGSADSAVIPMCCIDFPRTPSGIDIVWQVPPAGFYRSAD